MRDGEQDKAIGGQAGFTLVEMLVTLCVVALLGGALAGGLSHLARMRDITQTVNAEQELDATITYLQDLIAGSRNLPLLDRSPLKVPMTGDAGKLSFVSTARVSSERRVLRDVELALRSDGGVLTLVERHSVRRVAEQRLEAEFPILTGVSSLTFTYLARSGLSKAEWAATWQSDRLPRAIGINIEAIRDGRKISRKRIAFLGPSS